MGGVESTGGAAATGGDVATGGSDASGGSAANTPESGGSVATGGESAAGGSEATGGALETGGALSTGGSEATGGSSSTGGFNATGGNAAFRIGGSVTGLENGTLQLVNNGIDPLTITQSGDFQFATALATGADYDVRVSQQPAGSACVVSNGSGVIGATDVSDVAVSCGPALQSCRSIKTVYPDAPSGIYNVNPTGNAVVEVYCDMSTEGGGWTMCYTEKDAIVHVSSELVATQPFGTPGYRADCRNVPFTDVLYVNHDTDQIAWFSRQISGTLTLDALGYSAAGSGAGLFDGHGVASNSYNYQLLVCDAGWMQVGLMMSGFIGCYKSCGNWCSDMTTDYYRTDGDDGSYLPQEFNGVSFAQNGHGTVSYKVMSVGVR
jgi:hypothetical protein